MQSFFFTVLTLVMLALLIRVLHRVQQKRTLETVDRSMPLPPLLKDAEEPKVQKQSKEPTQETPPEDSSTQTASATSWLYLVKELREQKRFEEALQLSRRHYPKMQAFQQAMVTLRMHIKSLLKTGQSTEEQLKVLYNIAVVGDLFRSQNTAKPKQVNSALFDALFSTELPYQSIGFEELKLLNKSDIRFLQKQWGQPKTHQHFEQYLNSLKSHSQE